MSKKMWQKIFKSKAQKPPPLAKINKRHSRIVYEEYQQLSDLLAGGKEQLSSSNEKENEHENGNGNGPACGNGNGNGSINVFEQPPPQSSFNSSEFGEQHQPKQQLSTFSRVRNTFSIRRSSNSNSNNNSNSSKKLANATPSEWDAASEAATVATATLTNNQPGNQLQRVVIVVNTIDVATNCPTNHLHANSTATTHTATAIKPTTSSTTDRDQEDSGRGAEDEEPLPPPPPPLTSGSALPVPEHVPDQAVQLTPCPCCSRTFVVDALRKHIVICEKASKKRKIFDSSRQRRDGTALSTYVLPKNFGLPNAERTAGVPSPPANAREAPPAEPVNSPQPVRRKSQTELVRSTARASLRKAASTLSNTAANEAAGSGGPAGPPAAPPAREKSLAERIKPPPGDPCPHCERTFNPKAFDRHVEWCKEKTMLANMKGANKQETSKAKERLEARKKYKPPNLKTKRSVARDKYSGNHEELLEAGEMAAPKPSMMSLSMTSSVQSDNGLGNKYDPFLSAKRQLEELCSPSTPPPEEEEVTSTTRNTKTLTPLPTTTPTATPNIAMTTSLNTAISKPAQMALKSTPASNFRRTSSLRGPRRTPMLNSRPLFATNYRPTIQRGLSDEGPISTNFLKPEEFDEMPVRAACGNDFHSPRVVRRDTSASNRKQQLKLPVGGAGEASNAPSSPQAGRSVAKTDSLAVFLKYEHELEQLNAKAAELAAASQLTSKEQKDKSNTLSKQNSAKSLGQSTPTQLPPLTPAAVPPSPSAVKEVNYPPVATPLRLEPISRPAMNPLAPLTPIRLESIFGPRREAALGSGSGSVAGDFIDPKLINACDNLHVSSGISSDASSTPQQLSQSRSRSSSQSTITHERRQSGEARNLLKRKMRLGRNQFLYDASPEDADASSGCSADDEANRSSMEYDEQCWQQQQKQLLANPLPLVMPMVHNAMPTFDDFDFEEFLSSFENENDDEQFPLFKDCREFLLNRSTSRQRSFQKATSTPQATATPSTPHTPHSIHSVQSKIKDNHAHRSEAKAPEERLQRQRSNASNASSQEEKQSRQDMEKRMGAEDQQKREIFISIETEANAQGRSPISPDSLRHMVGNAQTPIDVLHIENGNEPEHARFSKISDTEDAGDESGDRTSQATATGRLAPSPSGSALAPNVQLNNAKNLIQQMQSDFRQLGEEASASMRRMLIVSGRGDEQQQQQQQASREVRDPNPIPNLEQEQQHIKANAPLTPSPSAESDELSSLDGYPMSSSHGSRRGASSKMSTDSAYGSSNSPYSLSRQRSSELQPVASHSQGLQRPHTASAMLAGGLTDSSPQTHSAHGGLKARKRLFVPESGSNGDGAELSISGPDHFLQQHQQISNYNYQQLQQQQLQQQQQQLQQQQPQQQQEKPLPQSLQDYNANNNLPITPTISEHSLNSNESMSSSMRISKYCHECGGKFILDTAKFCMECGMKRIIF
ncbi:nucleolar protein dao-5 isoform X4 [Drosophila ficusphila]|uniref:nucleolar protein dao-5 isoform X4 n=1 Tax=Drosophila ficusphila TaxID=30025 RepID=UPI0007E6AD68|nr:nucleolar protein dao-5 isoform X4 [Drosophila ficusphila]